jgi:HPt (histidine-containing phosphotransfer) domain-containing protein
MAHKHPIDLFMPPNMLKAKAGGGTGGIDMAALKRADAAMDALSSHFTDWLDKDIRALIAANDRFTADPCAETRTALLRTAHDIKGQAATFDFPVIARVAASLSTLLGESDPARPLPPGLANAHVQAVQVIRREDIRDGKNTVAETLCAELEAKVAETLAQS